MGIAVQEKVLRLLDHCRETDMLSWKAE